MSPHQVGLLQPSGPFQHVESVGSGDIRKTNFMCIHVGVKIQNGGLSLGFPLQPARSRWDSQKPTPMGSASLRRRYAPLAPVSGGGRRPALGEDFFWSGATRKWRPTKYSLGPRALLPCFGGGFHYSLGVWRFGGLDLRVPYRWESMSICRLTKFAYLEGISSGG